MKTLSIRQPWASLIIKGFKDVENRSWRTSIRGEIAVHASASKAEDDWEDAIITVAVIRAIALSEAKEWLIKTIGEFDKLPRGAILGTVEITDCKRERMSPWHFDENWGFYLQNPKELKKPIPAKGKRGFWDFDLSLAEAVK
jgi:hypothetical protein